VADNFNHDQLIKENLFADLPALQIVDAGVAVVSEYWHQIAIEYFLIDFLLKNETFIYFHKKS
jgi:hypothetical protein